MTMLRLSRFVVCLTLLACHALLAQGSGAADAHD